MFMQLQIIPTKILGLPHNFMIASQAGWYKSYLHGSFIPHHAINWTSLYIHGQVCNLMHGANSCRSYIAILLDLALSWFLATPLIETGEQPSIAWNIPYRLTHFAARVHTISWIPPTFSWICLHSFTLPAVNTRDQLAAKPNQLEIGTLYVLYNKYNSECASLFHQGLASVALALVLNLILV